MYTTDSHTGGRDTSVFSSTRTKFSGLIQTCNVLQFTFQAESLSIPCLRHTG